jgi:hypothetical protein
MFQTFISFFLSFEGLNKVAVMNGYFEGNSKIVEVVDLAKSTTNCKKLTNFAVITRGTHGGLLPDFTPIVCGGANSNNCYKYYINNWVQTYSMHVPRMHFTGMTGSPYQNSSHLYYVIGNGSAEVLTDSGWEVIGPPTPTQFYHSCLMVINETSILVFEGQVSGVRDYSPLTYIYNSVTNAWTSGPSLKRSRRAVGCGLIRKTEDSDEKIFIIAGGEGGGVSVELLDEIDGQWYRGNC